MNLQHLSVFKINQISTVKVINKDIDHSHKKRKDSLENSLDRVLFAAELENTSNFIECAGKSKQLYSLCDQLLGALIYLNFIILILIFL